MCMALKCFFSWRRYKSSRRSRDTTHHTCQIRMMAFFMMGLVACGMCIMWPKNPWLISLIIHLQSRLSWCCWDDFSFFLSVIPEMKSSKLWDLNPSVPKKWETSKHQLISYRPADFFLSLNHLCWLGIPESFSHHMASCPGGQQKLLMCAECLEGGGYDFGKKKLNVCIYIYIYVYINVYIYIYIMIMMV